MKLSQTLATLTISTALAACGAQTKKKSEEAPAPQTQNVEAADQEFSAIPKAAIVRVPVNEQGEPTGAPEMKIVMNDAALDSDGGVASAFTEGSAPESTIGSVDELDRSSSTQSWTAYDSNYGDSSYGESHTGGGYNNGGYNNGGYNSGGYNNGGYNSGGYNNGGYNNGYCRRGCGYHGYFSSYYRPVLYYRGYGWNYGYHRPRYNYSHGYSYYCYRPYRASYSTYLY